jgi:hypothetical protein
MEICSISFGVKEEILQKFFILIVVFIIVGVIPALRSSDDMLFADALAEGLGRTLAVGFLACLGLLYRPNRNLGFGIAAGILTVLVLIAVS